MIGLPVYFCTLQSTSIVTEKLLYFCFAQVWSQWVLISKSTLNSTEARHRLFLPGMNQGFVLLLVKKEVEAIYRERDGCGSTTFLERSNLKPSPCSPARAAARCKIDDVGLFIAMMLI